MARILAIDYGLKRTGLAVTDPLQIIASPLETVLTSELLEYLKKYFLAEQVETVVIGMPKKLDNTPSSNAANVQGFIYAFKREVPAMNLVEVDERFTSVMAMNAMIEGGMKKKDRQVKGNVDKISATIILQSYLSSKR
jgi:putative Holliday junction resolvase